MYIAGRLVLANNHPVKTEGDDIKEGRMELIRTRTQSWGDQKLVEKMVPGYTGVYMCGVQVGTCTCVGAYSCGVQL